ncbi:Calpain-5 [Fasciola gigantica]|uniref:Calpain-5 n=1 Tax=Fasciola gigantica TaxID=46835 RepID=A0A504YN37_FASGI|nr:Calpain-5 [Fasciola gigantica]
MNYRGQEVAQIRAACVRTGTLFTDPEFPACLASLTGDRQKLKNPSVYWRRPTEICAHPRFVGCTYASPARQGRLGNCWFVAACACLVRDPSLMKRVLISPRYNQWSKYCGVFEFRFWRFGVWVTVVVDDRLPTLDGELLYCHAYKSDEFWCSLLEKAYAKLLGSYEALEGGELADALVDFTGGFPECLKFCPGQSSGLPVKEKCFEGPVSGFHRPKVSIKPGSDGWNIEKLFDILTRFHLSGTLIAAAVSAECTTDQEKETDLGLVVGHAYAVIRMCAFPTTSFNGAARDGAITSRTRSISLVCLINPWGHGQWKGAFSCGSPVSKISDMQLTSYPTVTFNLFLFAL